MYMYCFLVGDKACWLQIQERQKELKKKKRAPPPSPPTATTLKILQSFSLRFSLSAVAEFANKC